MKADETMLGGSSSLCAICINEDNRVALGDEVRVLPCNHWYHTGCFYSWLRIRRNCPMCRRKAWREVAFATRASEGMKFLLVFWAELVEGQIVSLEVTGELVAVEWEDSGCRKDFNRSLEVFSNQLKNNYCRLMSFRMLKDILMRCYCY